MLNFVKELDLLCTQEELWDWHCSDGAFNRLVPPWQKLSLERFDGIVEGGLGVIRLSAGPFKLRWYARHLEVSPPESFVDLQEKGPFKYWRHQHSMIEKGSSNSTLRDEVEFSLPLSFISESLGKGIALKQLENLFSYRHRIMLGDITSHQKMKKKKLSVLISGASGLLGKQLTAFFGSAGHEVSRLVRREPKGDSEIIWSPADGVLDLPADKHFDVVVHLSGANVGKIPWSDSYKKVILDSRVDTTSLLVSKLMEHPKPPSLFISASGIGFYGERGDEIAESSDEVGDSFLAGVCERWEAESLPLENTDIRRVVLRLGPVVSSAGGMLEKLLLPAKMGLGATIGEGKEWVSWVALDDVLYAIEHVIANESIRGPINLCSPKPVRMVEFMDTLSSVLSRPRFLRAPKGLLKMLGGEAIEAMVLTSAKAMPRALEESNFEFTYPDLRKAIEHTLGMSSSS